MHAFLKVSMSIFFVLCLADMPYSYYQFVRFYGMIGFAILAKNENDEENELMMYFYLSSAILINPIFKIALGRELWNIIDLIWAVILVWSILKQKK